jgi:hypothetical protein
MIKAQEPGATHTEAPASVNTKLTLAGREIQLTLRDSDEKRLLVRLAEVLAQFPVETAIPTEGFCVLHHTTMTKRHGKYGEFYSHKTREGWCQG